MPDQDRILDLLQPSRRGTSQLQYGFDPKLTDIGAELFHNPVPFLIPIHIVALNHRALLGSSFRSYPWLFLSSSTSNIDILSQSYVLDHACAVVWHKVRLDLQLVKTDLNRRNSYVTWNCLFRGNRARYPDLYFCNRQPQMINHGSNCFLRSSFERCNSDLRRQ